MNVHFENVRSSNHNMRTKFVYSGYHWVLAQTRRILCVLAAFAVLHVTALALYPSNTVSVLPITNMYCRAMTKNFICPMSIHTFTNTTKSIPDMTCPVIASTVNYLAPPAGLVKQGTKNEKPVQYKTITLHTDRDIRTLSITASSDNGELDDCLPGSTPVRQYLKTTYGMYKLPLDQSFVGNSILLGCTPSRTVKNIGQITKLKCTRNMYRRHDFIAYLRGCILYSPLVKYVRCSYKHCQLDPPDSCSTPTRVLGGGLNQKIWS